MIRKIIVILLVVYGLAMTVYANLQTRALVASEERAKEQEFIATQKAAEARAAEARAVQQQALAEAVKEQAVTAQMEAEKQRDLAKKALANCN